MESEVRQKLPNYTEEHTTWNLRARIYYVKGVPYVSAKAAVRLIAYNTELTPKMAEDQVKYSGLLDTSIDAAEYNYTQVNTLVELEGVRDIISKFKSI